MKFSDVVVGLANPGWQTVPKPWSSGCEAPIAEPCVGPWSARSVAHCCCVVLVVGGTERSHSAGTARSVQTSQTSRSTKVNKSHYMLGFVITTLHASLWQRTYWKQSCAYESLHQLL